LNSRPPHVALLQQAYGLLRSGRHNDARRVVARLLELSPQNVEALTLNAQLALQAGDLDAAMQAIDVAALLAPEAAGVQYGRGRIFSARGEPSLAVECYQRATRADPASADILNSLGNALRALGRAQEGIAAYRQALALEPGHLYASSNLAHALEGLGDVTSARAQRESAREAVVSRLTALHAKAHELVERGKPRAALDVLQEALATAPDPYTLLWAAELATVNGDFQLGLAFADQLLAIEPDNVQALRLACLLTVGAGLLERVPHYAQPLMRLAPEDEVPLLVGLSLPAIQDSRESIFAARAAYEAVLDELLQRDIQI
jgi:tetratricopeptide (TPR) repeat protein